MAGAVIAPALWVAVIDVRVQPLAGAVFKLLVSHCAKRNAPLFARLFVAQYGVVFFAPDTGTLKPHELVVIGVVNNHAYAPMHVFT